MTMESAAGATNPPLTGHRVALVAANFSPEIGYQEVDLARSFNRLGAEVLVVTSTRPSRNARGVVSANYLPGLTEGIGYAILRLRPKAVIGTSVLGCKVLPPIQDFSPDHVVIVGPGKLFGLDLFADATAPWSRIVLIQDNSDDGRSGGPLAKRALRAAAWRTVRRAAYRRVVRNADRIVLNVPETREIVNRSLRRDGRRRLAEISMELPLGFDPTRFYFDHEARRRWRALHGVGGDEVLVVTCTRATRSKRLEVLVDMMARVRARGLPVRYVLAGLLDDAYGHEIREQVARLRDPLGFVLLPALRQDEMRELFSACDLGYWPQAAITIQQAMGTGLVVVLPRKRSLAHLLVEGRNGWYVEPEERPDEVVLGAIDSLRADRQSEHDGRARPTADFNRRYLSYDRLAAELLACTATARNVPEGNG